MSHLTAEQIEQMIETPDRIHGHLSECPLCRQRFEEAMAIRRRFQQAFVSVHADDALKHRVVSGIRSASRRKTPGKAYVLFRRISPSLAAAAAIVLVTVSLTLYMAEPQQAHAASSELVQIHQTNLMPHAELYGSSDPDKVAAYFKKQLGFVPAFPRLGAGMGLRGCCVAYFRNRPVGSYVVDTDRGVISIIVLRDTPGTLKFGGQVRNDGQTYHTGAFARNRMAAVEIGDYTYCAVGETDAQWLVELLQSLLLTLKQ